MKRLLLTTTLALLLLAGSDTGRAAPVTLKVATVMPRGGPWANAMVRFAAQVKKQTRGQVVIKIYFGAVAGTERRALGRMKAGQIQGLVATSTGPASIERSIRVLELPMLYRSHKEFRFVLRSMSPIFKQRYKKKGYRLMSMASIGWVYLYSKKPIYSLADIRRSKFWRWKHDPLVVLLYKTIGIKGNRLPITDVLASLQAGTIDSVYGPPHSTQALQWHTRVKYVLDFKVNMAIGLMLVRNDAFAQLTAAQQKIVEAAGLRMQTTVNKSTAYLNIRAMRAMRKSGLTLLKPSAAFTKQLRGLRPMLLRKMKNTIYKPADLKKVKALLTLCHATSCGVSASTRRSR